MGSTAATLVCLDRERDRGRDRTRGELAAVGESMSKLPSLYERLEVRSGDICSGAEMGRLPTLIGVTLFCRWKAGEEKEEKEQRKVGEVGRFREP